MKSKEKRYVRIRRVYFNRMFPKRMDAFKVASSVGRVFFLEFVLL
jgi:hypothetical protein